MLLSLLTTRTIGATCKRSALQVAERCFQGIPMLSCFFFSFSFLPPPSPLPAPASLTHFPIFPLVFPPLPVFPLSPLLPLSSPSSLSPPPVLLSLCRHLLPSPPLPSFPSLTSTSSALPSLRRVFPPFRCFCFLPSFCPSSASPLLFPFSIVRLAFAVVFAIVFALVCLTRILALAV